MKKQLAAAALVIAVIIGVVIGLRCVAIIPANSVGVLYSPVSGTKNETLKEGIQFKGPFDIVYKLSTEVQTRNIMDISGQTKDAQYLSMNIDIKYRIDEANAFEVFKQFRTLDNMDSSLISPTVQRAVETVTTQYNVIDILGEKRNEVYAQIENELIQRLEVNGVSFYSITFTDTDAGSEIESAIRAEAVAKKAVETAEQERQKALVQAETLKVEAQGRADAEIIEAMGKAEAYREKADALSEEILYIEFLEKWNGELPKVTSDGSLMLDISSVIGETESQSQTQSQTE